MFGRHGEQYDFQSNQKAIKHSKHRLDKASFPKVLPNSITFLCSSRLDTKFKIQLVPIPLTGRPSKSEYFHHLRDFYRSDHYNFWENSVSFPAVMLTDTSNFRGSMARCYHRKCDSMRLVDKKDLRFLRRNINAVIGTILELSDLGRFGKSKELH